MKKVRKIQTGTSNLSARKKNVDETESELTARSLSESKSSEYISGSGRAKSISPIKVQQMVILIFFRFLYFSYINNQV